MAKPSKQPSPEKVLNLYGLPALGYSVEDLDTGNWLQDQVFIEAMCFRIGLRPDEGGLGKFGHFKRYTDLLINNPDLGGTKRFIWNTWSEKILREACDEDFLGIAGCACVAGDTRMYDPITGKSPTIQSLCEAGIRPTVQTLNGPVLADVPYIKGEEELFEFKLSNGGSFRCTAKHRLLSSKGWIFAREVSVGHSIFGYSPILQDSISGNALSGQQRGVRHCSETVVDSQSGCRLSPRLCGESLHLARGIAQEKPPSQGGVRECSGCASGHSGVLLHGLGCSRRYQSSYLSTHSVFHLFLWLGNLLSHRCVGETFSLLVRLSRRLSPFQRGNTHLRTSGEPSPHLHRRPHWVSFASQVLGLKPRGCSECSSQSSEECLSDQLQVGNSSAPETDQALSHSSRHSVSISCALKVSHVQVVSIRNLGVHKFYDLNVPVEHHYFAEGAIHHNSAGKTDPVAWWVVANYCMDATHIRAFVASTTIKLAKDRIWKMIQEYFGAIPNMPGRLLPSTNEIRGLKYDRSGYGDASGIRLLATEKSAEATALESLIGIKAPRTGTPDDSLDALKGHIEFVDLVKIHDDDYLADLLPRLQSLIDDRTGKILFAIDEATGCAQGVLNAILSNMRPGNEGRLQVIMIGNPASHFDVHGQFCEPEAGWNSVTLADKEWRTKIGGKCIRFDATENPRITEKNEKLSWMPSKQAIETMARDFGVESLYYYRMVLGFWFPLGMEAGVYSEADFIATNSFDKATWGFQPPKKLCTLDPSFTVGGDRASCTFFKLGNDTNGIQVLERDGEAITIMADATNKVIPVPTQYVQNWKKECVKRGIPPENCAFDATGGGISFAAIVSMVWSSKVLAISSGGKASKEPIGREKGPDGKKITAAERFKDKATEVWYGAKAYLRSNQIRGVTMELAKEICSRQHEKENAGDSRVLKIENKRKFKSRTKGGSPDDSDSFFLGVELAKRRFGFKPSEKAAIPETEDGQPGESAWDVFKRRARRLYGKKRLPTH